MGKMMTVDGESTEVQAKGGKDENNLSKKTL